MTFYKYKEKRIRSSNKSLVYRFCCGSFLFVAVILLMNIGQLMCTDWEKFTLISNDRLTFSLSPYNFITLIVATGICILVAFLYYRFCYDRYKQLLHRQNLACMILENSWHEAQTTQGTTFSLIYSPAGQRRTSATFPVYITAWKKACSISRVKSRWESIKTSFCS